MNNKPSISSLILLMGFMVSSCTAQGRQGLTSAFNALGQEKSRAQVSQFDVLRAKANTILADAKRIVDSTKPGQPSANRSSAGVKVAAELDDSDSAERIAELEERVSRLEKLVEQLLAARSESDDDDTNEADDEAGSKNSNSGAAFRATTRGYASASMYVNPYYTGRCRVSVNGMLVGIYSKRTYVPIAAFLEKGKVNRVSYEFTPHKKGGSIARATATISVRLPGRKQWLKVLESSGKASESFDLPIVTEVTGK